ncbi:MAG: YbaB/EbfC family nucleoid-associated protein [Phycisphaerales bacterium]
MFDKLRAVTAIAGLMKDKDRLREAGVRLKAKATALRAPGESGSGAVRVVADGKFRLVSVEIAPALLAGMADDERTRALGGSLIVEAATAALALAQDHMQAELRREASALGLDDLPIDLSDLGGLLS